MDTTNVSILIVGGDMLKGKILRDSRLTGKQPAILVLHGYTSSMTRYPERDHHEIR